MLVVASKTLCAFSLLMLTFCFPNVYLGHAESLTLVVTDSSIDVRGE